jgi:nucleoside-diphosphate-sugar epimerase
VTRPLRILFIGGSNMTGPFAVRELIAHSHEVWLLHRTPSELPMLRGATQIRADKADLPKHRADLAALRLDVAVHMAAFTEADAASFIELLPAIAPRAMVISSIDVYRAYGRLSRTEPGPTDAVPLDEDAPLRTKVANEAARDKVAVERAARFNPNLPCTILRYPAVYGPSDSRHRLRGWVQRMDDGRPFILMGQSQAGWRFTHGYVENVAAALVLAITNPQAIGRIYNVGEADPPSWAQWAGQIASAANWRGGVRVIADRHLPPHLAADLDFRQDWLVDTSRIRRELSYREVVGAQECLERAIAWERSCEFARDPGEFNYDAEDAAIKNATGDGR